MSKEQWLESYPKDISPELYFDYYMLIVLIILVIFLVYLVWELSKKRSTYVVGQTPFILLFSLCITLLVWVGDSIMSEYKAMDKSSSVQGEWRAEFKQKYISRLPKVRLEVVDYVLTEKGTLTAVAEVGDITETFPNIQNSGKSETGKDYIEYTKVSGLDEYGFSTGKYDLILYLADK